MPAYQVALIARRAFLNGKTSEAIKMIGSVLPHFEQHGPEGTLRNMLADLVEGHCLLHRIDQADELMRRYETRVASAAPTAVLDLQKNRLRALLAIEHHRLAAVHAHAETMVIALDASPNLRLPALAKARLDAGWFFLRTGDLAKAQQQAELTLALGKARTFEGLPSAWIGAASRLLYQVHTQKGDTGKAAASLELARQQLERSVTPDHPWRQSLP